MLEAHGNDPRNLLCRRSTWELDVPRRQPHRNTASTELDKVRRQLLDSGYKISVAELSMLPKNSVALDEHAAVQTLKLLT